MSIQAVSPFSMFTSSSCEPLRSRCGPPSCEEQPFECAQAREVVRGRECAQVRERRLHALSERLVTLASGQGVQPDEPAAALLQQLELLAQLYRVARVPAVT